MTRNAIALLRVSSTAQAGPDRHGLSVQRGTCERIAAHHGLTIVEWVELEGVSGAAVLSDPRFAALLSRLGSPNLHGVIVGAFDRLMRPESLADYAILERFRETATVLYTPEGPRDLRDFGGRVLSVLQGEIGAAERESIRQRTMAGRRKKRRHGVRAEGLVGMPRGVRFDSATQRWEYVFPEASQVKKCFALFLNGTTNLAEISRRTGIGATERSSAILRILRQPLYAGIYRVDRTWEQKRMRRLPPDEVQEYTVVDPPLIPLAEWQEAQRILARLRATRPARRTDVPGVYRGHLVCSACGRVLLAVRDSRGYGAYTCARRHGSPCPGTSRRISVRLADPQLDAQIEAILGSPETLEHLAAAAIREAGRTAATSTRELERRLVLLDERRRRALDAHETGLTSIEEAAKRLARIADQRAAVEAEMGSDDAGEIPDGWLVEVAEIFASWAILRPADRRSLLDAWRLEIGVERPAPGVVRVDRMRLLGLPSGVWLYKKMQRLGIV
jgi:DNA invertase Pin-like site-specific DNA recombinase